MGQNLDIENEAVRLPVIVESFESFSSEELDACLRVYLHSEKKSEPDARHVRHDLASARRFRDALRAHDSVKIFDERQQSQHHTRWDLAVAIDESDDVALRLLESFSKSPALALAVLVVRDDDLMNGQQTLELLDELLDFRLVSRRN